MSEIEINNIKNNLEKILNSGKEPIYCEELITSGELKRLLEEIERLNNIIKEFEKELEKERKIDRPRDDYNYGLTNALDYVWYKLQELKGSDKD